MCRFIKFMFLFGLQKIYRNVSLSKTPLPVQLLLANLLLMVFEYVLCNLFTVSQNAILSRDAPPPGGGRGLLFLGRGIPLECFGSFFGTPKKKWRHMNSISRNSILLGKSCMLLSVLLYLLCYKVWPKNAYCCSICIMLMNMYFNYSGRLRMWLCLHVSFTLLTKQRIRWPMAYLSVPADRVPTAWQYARWKCTP